jgi:hypothetical protein
VSLCWDFDSRDLVRNWQDQVWKNPSREFKYFARLGRDQVGKKKVGIWSGPGREKAVEIRSGPSRESGYLRVHTLLTCCRCCPHLMGRPSQPAYCTSQSTALRPLGWSAQSLTQYCCYARLVFLALTVAHGWWALPGPKWLPACCWLTASSCACLVLGVSDVFWVHAGPS